MHPPDLGQQLRLADHPVTDWAAHELVVGARGGQAAVLRQHPADRLDPEGPTMNRVVTMLVDDLHERGNGRSSSAAKADAEMLEDPLSAYRTFGMPTYAA